MIALPILDSHSLALRVEALHAITYCPCLFYLQEVERIEAPDERLYADRKLHAGLAADDDAEQISIELTSEKLGLTGKVDCLRRRDGSYVPYEHKRGQPRRPDDGSPEPWPSDRIQLHPVSTPPPVLYHEPRRLFPRLPRWSPDGQACEWRKLLAKEASECGGRSTTGWQ